MTIARQLTLSIVREITADKQARHIEPHYPTEAEVITRVRQALQTLVDDGTLIPRQLSVNRIPAYQLPNVCK